MELNIPLAVIEAAMVERLRLGLGKMVRAVDTYGGELDGSLANVVRRFPAAWVTFKGVLNTRATGTSRARYDAHGRFVVMVGASTLRSESATRRGGPRVEDVGTYQLIYAVRRLLTNQDLGLAGVDYLQPGAVRTLFNGAAQGKAASIFALEFDTSWTERPLDAGRWPAPTLEDIADPKSSDPDVMFSHAKATTDEPYGLMTAVELDIRLSNRTTEDPPDASALITLNKDH